MSKAAGVAEASFPQIQADRDPAAARKLRRAANCADAPVSLIFIVFAYFQQLAAIAANSLQLDRTCLTTLRPNAIVMPQIGSPTLLPFLNGSSRRGTMDSLRRV